MHLNSLCGFFHRRHKCTWNVKVTTLTFPYAHSIIHIYTACDSNHKDWSYKTQTVGSGAAWLLFSWGERERGWMSRRLLSGTLKVLNFWKITSYCNLKPLWSGMGEVVPARSSPTLHPPSPPTVHQLSWLALWELTLPYPRNFQFVDTLAYVLCRIHHNTLFNLRRI